MKLQLLALFASLSFCIACSAQNFVPFGEFSSEEKEMKHCDFDTDADAVVLLREAYSNYDDNYQLITRYHVRIKILKDKGIGDNANVTIRYWRDGDFEKIYVKKAATFNTDAAGAISSINVDRKSVFTQKINDKIGEVSFAFPGVKEGSILEYEYESNMRHYGGLEDWYFQEERPVLSSRYTLVIVPNAEFAYQVVKRPDFNVVVKQDDVAHSVYFEMNRVPGLRNEPYIDARKDYLQKVWLQLSRYRMGDGFGGTKYMTSWDEVNREMSLNESFGRYIGKSVPGTDTFIARIKQLPDESQKIKQVFEFVRGRMKWNNIFSLYLGDGFKEAWAKKTGSSSEINMILLNLLKDAGLDATPVLVSRRHQGKVDATYPFIGQFHSLVARVNTSGHAYYLDGIEDYIPWSMTPDELLNTTAFVLGRKKGELVNITDETSSYSERLLILAGIMDDGMVRGNVQVSSEGYAKADKLEKLMEKGEAGLMNEYFSNDKLQVKTDSFSVKDKESDSLPLQQLFGFHTPLKENGGYILLPVNLFSGLSNNPFTNDNRFSNINFGYKRSVAVVLKIHVSAEYTVDELPKPVRMITPDKDIEMSRMVEYNKDEGQLNCLIKVNFNKSYYLLQDYPILKEFYKKMIDFLNEPVVLKRK